MLAQSTHQNATNFHAAIKAIKVFVSYSYRYIVICNNIVERCGSPAERIEEAPISRHQGAVTLEQLGLNDVIVNKPT